MNNPQTVEEVDEILAEITACGLDYIEDKHLCPECREQVKGAKAKLSKLIDKAVREANQAKDDAYKERNQLVAYLSKQYEAHMVRHPDSDEDWEDDWRWIICIHAPTGQMTWHIHDTDVQIFGHLIVEPDAEHWDGHTTEEKYQRLEALKSKNRGKKNWPTEPLSPEEVLKVQIETDKEVRG